MTVDVPAEFLNFLRTEQGRGYDPALEDNRANAIRFYDGQKYGDEVEGRSQAVTRDVAEVIDTQQVGILNVVLASGKAVEFETEPESQTDENGQPVVNPQTQQPIMVDYGEEATAAVRYQFFRRQKGYKILHDALKAGQMEMSGVVKTFAEPQPPLTEVRQVTADEIEETPDGMMVGGMTVLSADALDEGWEPGMPSMLWRVALEVPQPPIFRDVAVPNENFRVSPDAEDLDEAVYVGEHLRKSVSDLVKLGYDYDLLMTLWGEGAIDTVVQQARDDNRSVTEQSVGQRQGANKILWLEEEYVLYDLNGDGIAERLFVHRVGNTVLKVMEVDEQPYSLWSPFPRQHRLIGESTADKTMDIQRIRSVLLRQGLDSLYLSNSPRTLVAEEAMTIDTIDDLLTVRPGGLVRYKGANRPEPLAQQDTSATAFQGMEMMTAERESRTGVTRQSQGLNPDTMNKTATGMSMLMAQSQQIEQYVTRNFVEFIVASIFAKRYRLMRKFGQPFRMKIEGKYRTVDPRKWPEEIDMNINVGLGTGNKDQKVQARTALLQIQQGIVQNGGRIVTEEQVYQNVRGFVEDSGLGSPSEYVLNPADLPPPEEKPDPEMVKIQAEMQTQQAKDQQAHDREVTKLMLQQQQQEAENALSVRQQDFDLSAKRESAALDAQLKQQRADFEADLAIRQQNFEMTLAEQRFAFDQEMARKKNEQADNSDDSIPSYRPGGALDQ